MIEGDRAFVIQRTPTGLLDLLGMQSTGNLPHSLDKAVQSSVDVFDLYTIDRLRVTFGQTPVIAGIGFQGANFGPPPGELWVVYSLNVTSGALAAASSISWCYVTNRQGSTSQGQLLNSPQLLTGPAAFADGLIFDRPLILRPGDILGLQIGAVTGVPAVAPFVAAWIVALKI